jgi:hypothetical protein
LTRGSQAIEQELTPILSRAAELVKEGRSKEEAHSIAMREWGERVK